MKKFFVLFLVLAVFTSVVFAGGEKESTDSGKPIELVYWSHYGQSPKFVQAFADTANAALKKIGYDNVTVRAEVIEYGGYMTKYVTAFASGNGPDMFLANVSDFALEGGVNPVALPFPEELNKTWTDALAGFAKTDGVFSGKRYGFAAEGGSLMLLYVNTDYMKQAGIDPINGYPKNFEELVTVAKKLTTYDANGKIIRSGYQPRFLGGGAGTSGKFVPFLHQNGARVLSPDFKKAEGFINSPESIEVFQWYQDLVTKHKVANLDFGSPETAFQSGQTAMIFREGWFAQDVIDKAPNIKFVAYPFISGKKTLAPTQGGSAWVNMINSKSKYTDICLALFKELAKPEYDVMLHEPAAYPPVLSATMTMDNPYFGKLPYAKATMDMIAWPASPVYDATAKWTTIAGMLGDTIAPVLQGSDVKTTIDNLAKKMQVVLDQK